MCQLVLFHEQFKSTKLTPVWNSNIYLHNYTYTDNKSQQIQSISPMYYTTQLYILELAAVNVTEISNTETVHKSTVNFQRTQKFECVLEEQLYL